MSSKFEYSEDWLIKLPAGVYQHLLPFILFNKNTTQLRTTCKFFRDKYKVKKYSDINFMSKDPTIKRFTMPSFEHNASLVYPLTDGRFVVIAEDNIIRILSCTDIQNGTLSEQMELLCDPLNYNYNAKFLIAELSDNVLLVMNHHTFYMWDISPCEEFESRQLSGIHDFVTKSSATCLVQLSSKLMAFGFEENKIYIMDMTEGSLSAEITTSAPVRELSVNFKGELIAVCESDNYVVFCFDPKNKFVQTDEHVLKPMKPIKELTLSRIIVRNNHIYSEQYIGENDKIQTIWFSDRVNEHQGQLEATSLGACKSYIGPDATAVFWNTEDDLQDPWVQVKVYPRTAPEFSICF